MNTLLYLKWLTNKDLLYSKENFGRTSPPRPAPVAHGTVVPRPGIEPMPSVLEGRILTTGEPEKSSSHAL